MDLLLNQKLEKIINGRATYISSNLGFNLLISRLQKRYSGNRTSAELSACVREINEFIAKYNSIMSKELDQIKKI